jgi:predicted metal-dependent phosphoesterase TrpH
MIIDMHVHTQVSDDCWVTPETYLNWVNILRKNHNISGLAFTEHRKFDSSVDYDRLAREFEVVIFQGIELETDCGHFLVYGDLDEILKSLDTSDVNLDAVHLLKVVENAGGIAIPAHPGRKNIGFSYHVDNGRDYESVRVIESLNGASREAENNLADKLAAERNYFGIGGSDAHFVSDLCSCLTEFENEFSTWEELVSELKTGNYRPIRLKDAKNF